jgi:protoporphyrinogen oxidase
MASGARVGVIGGGFMGMALAYYLAESGQHVTVLEQGMSIGGLHEMIQTEDGLNISRYPHYFSPHDTTILTLIKSLGLQPQLQTQLADSGFVHHGATYPLTSIKDFLHFGPLHFLDRMRLAQTLVQARLQRDWEMLDKIPARDWLIQHGGQSNFDKIWAPLLEAKFDYSYDDVPATFIWSWVNRMLAIRQSSQFNGAVVFLQYGPQSMIQALADAIIARGGEIRTQVRVREIELHNEGIGQLRTNAGMMQFDAVIAAIPTPHFSRLLLSAQQSYLDTLDRVQYLGLICPLLVLDRPLSAYWTLNLTDPSSPFSSITQLPHPENPDHTLVYLPKYTAPENDWMGVPDETIRDAWMVRLRQIYPGLKPEYVQQFNVSRSRYVDPVYRLNSAHQIPGFETPYPGLYLANGSQVYPELPTHEALLNYARRMTQVLIAQAKPRVMPITAA